MSKKTAINDRTKKLRLILGDQLNASHSWFRELPDTARYVLMEVRSETDYCIHHIQKVVAFFKSMRRFSETLKQQGFEVQYLALDDPSNKQSISENIVSLTQKDTYSCFEYQLPDEYRLDQELQHLSATLAVPVVAVDTEHFFTTRNEVTDLFQGKKQFLMESFYREMRKKHVVLMSRGKPEGEQWNFDTENRKKLPKTQSIPPSITFNSSVTDLVTLLKKCKVKTFGEIDPNKFTWATSREEGLVLLEHFCRELLPLFGTYQDAMTISHDTLFHSQLSFVLNVKLLSPQEVIDRVIREFRSRPNEISLSQAEGFVRQILGWREYMRGMYWSMMPAFKKENFLGHSRPLPSFFWSGNTKMNCVRHAVSQSLRTAYAHHIQRLMITGNFALLAGVDPDELDRWYLGIYADAVEWVQITNTRGMSQFADGGKIATKPYVSSANYIHKMSNYCDGCAYDREKRTGSMACPFNSLYWNFFITHKEKLKKNPRIGMAYRNIDRMSHSEIKQITAQAEHYLSDIEKL
jgi:deoxyribodipyrimidine photolyase-related protein